MYTSLDKALAALAMAIIYLLNTFFGKHITTSPETINSIIALLTPVIVYLVPNKPKN